MTYPSAAGHNNRHRDNMALRYQPRTTRPRFAAVFSRTDHVVIERLVSGEAVGSFTAFERREAVLRLRQLGWSYRQIAGRVGIAQRQVHRDLDRAGLIHRRASEPESVGIVGIMETAPSGLEPDSTPDLNTTCAYRRRTG